MSTNRLRPLLGVALVFAALAPPLPAAGEIRPQGGRSLPVSCEACVVIDDLGRTLWARAAHSPLPNASTTKMVTALLTTQRASVDETATVSQAAGTVGGGGLDLQPGDRYRVLDLLVAMLLSSSNEAAATLAEHVGGSQGTFVRWMNAYLHRLGATGTHFENPHGLDEVGHQATAADLAAIGAEVLADPVLAPIVGSSRAQIATPHGPVTEVNRNLLLESYEGAIGIKTGRTLGAGNVLVAAARRGKRTLIAVAMRSLDAAADARVLLDEGFQTVRRLDRRRSTRLLERGTVVGTIVFDPAGSVPVVASEPVTLDLRPHPPAVHYRLSTRRVSAPVRAGQPIGQVDLVAGGRVLATVPVRIGDGVEGGESPVVPDLLGRVIAIVADVVATLT